MKKLIILLLLLLPLCGCGKKDNESTATYSSSEETNQNQSGVIKEDSFSNLKKLDYNQVKTKKLYKDTFILVVTQTSCIHCHDFKPVLNSVLESKDILGYELDVQVLSEKDKKAALEELNVDTTPQTLFFVNGVEKKEYRLRGEATSKEIEDVIKKLKY